MYEITMVFALLLNICCQMVIPCGLQREAILCVITWYNSRKKNNVHFFVWLLWIGHKWTEAILHTENSTITKIPETARIFKRKYKNKISKLLCLCERTLRHERNVRYKKNDQFQNSKPEASRYCYVIIVVITVTHCNCGGNEDDRKFFRANISK